MTLRPMKLPGQGQSMQTRAAQRGRASEFPRGCVRGASRSRHTCAAAGLPAFKQLWAIRPAIFCWLAELGLFGGKARCTMPPPSLVLPARVHSDD
jgi:hypothetical protein